jgi:hypothetical protein
MRTFEHIKGTLSNVKGLNRGVPQMIWHAGHGTLAAFAIFTFGDTILDWTDPTAFHRE